MWENCLLHSHQDGFEIMKDDDFLLEVDYWDEAFNYSFNSSNLTVKPDSENGMLNFLEA